MRRALVIAACAQLLACAPPSQNNPDVYGSVRVAFGPSLDGITDWRPDQHPYLVEELAKLAALGPDFPLTDEGSADVVVRTFDSGPGCALGSGRYTRGLAFVEVDPACCAGYLEIQQAVGHEVMHWVTDHRWGWVGHICQNAGDAPDCHPSIFGQALLNPALHVMDMGPTFDEAWAPVGGDGTPLHPDLDLFARCQARGCM